jgi:hypothetical protein
MSGWAILSRLLLPALALVLLAAPSGAAAEGLGGGATAWRLEQPKPPKPPPGAQESSLPIGLGTVGDIEFAAPNRGLLITAGDPPTIPAGVWAYNGVEWHEIAEVCGGAEGQGGRIAWTGAGEFWTVSVGRPGQTGALNEQHEPPPLSDNTLCHFSGGQVVASYAHPAFEADSYGVMQAAACFEPSDCWFAGEALESPQVGAFQLHWNGSSLEAEPYPGEGHSVEDMALLGTRLYDSVRISKTDAVTSEEFNEPPAVHWFNPAGTQPTFGAEPGIPLYAERELPEALDFLHLSSADGTLWGAASAKQTSDSPQPGQVTVVRRVEGSWSQLIGPGSEQTSSNPLGPILPAEEEARLLGGEAKDAVVSSIAAEPGTDSAWIALKSPASEQVVARAVLVRVSGEGKVLEEQTLPSNKETEEGVGPKGAAASVSCPQVEDCWLVTTQGWLFHLAPEGERTLPKDPNESEYFKGLITFRPRDLGLPQVPPDAPPPDTSGLVEEAPDYGGTFAESAAPPPAALAKVALPLLSHMHSHLVHGHTLELRFHLAVEARIRLVAKRHNKVVASTPDRTFKAGNRKLLLPLNPRRWPTKLSLQTRALAPLPLVSSVTGEGANVTTETTGLHVLPRTASPIELGSLP